MSHPSSDDLIASRTELAPIEEIASRLGLLEGEWVPYGRAVAKVDAERVTDRRQSHSPGRLVLVSAMTPTPAGEGKTTTSIGLAQALHERGESVCLALREPSLGPCMGVKGGGTGGGHAQIAPADRINLHFTGDLHAVTTAHNFLAALVDNHLHHGNELDLDVRRITWRRSLDMNDRSLRAITVGLGGIGGGVPRETGFDITAASPVMATLCLASDAEDLRARLARIVVGYRRDRTAVRAGDIRAEAPMLALLGEALRPNLVQTLEGVPALIHGGPFANIAHGCNSLIATRTARSLAHWTVTEAGFGFDLGAEKFLHLKCRPNDLWPDATVLVATVRALKMHGGVARDALGDPNVDAVRIGLDNLVHHVETARGFGLEPIVALNHFEADTNEELAAASERLAQMDVKSAVCRHYAHGGGGALELADAVRARASEPRAEPRFAYPLDSTLEEKIEAIATRVYGASGIELTREARADIKRLRREGAGSYPVCMAKTQSSLSDDPKRVGRPQGFHLLVRALEANHGAGFVVALTGTIVRMPGLPKHPMSEHIDWRDGRITGIQ